MSHSRRIIQAVLSKEQRDGVGARVRRSIGSHELRNLDPFLMLDEFAVEKPAGFPDHPHRGFETVTYMLTGVFQHEDFAGHRGKIGPGDLQWMTAGKGIVHAEIPYSDGLLHGLQLWVNLPKKEKMCEPRYQELLDKDIPKVQPKEGVDIKVIAGESFGAKSNVMTKTPTYYLDFKMKKGTTIQQPIPVNWTAFAYILSGKGVFGPSGSAEQSAHHTLVTSNGSEESHIDVTATDDLHFVLIAGKPLKEPIVQYGPFVMTTDEEIEQAISDYRNGRNGFERAIGFQSEIAKKGGYLD